MPSYLLKGGDKLPTARKVNRHAAVATDYRHGTSALNRTNTERTLGASTRVGWRLSCGAAERAAHNAVATRNDAQYVSVSAPLAYVSRDTYALATDEVGAYDVKPVGDPVMPVVEPLTQLRRMAVKGETVDPFDQADVLHKVRR